MNLNNPEQDGHTKSSIKEMVTLINNDPKLLEALAFWKLLQKLSVCNCLFNERNGPHHESCNVMLVAKALSTSPADFAKEWTRTDGIVPILNAALNYFYPSREKDGDAACEARQALFELRDRLEGAELAKEKAGEVGK